MIVPSNVMSDVLADLCNEWQILEAQGYLSTYYGKLTTIHLLFQIDGELITANLRTIVKEDKPEDWGYKLYQALREHQIELGIDYD